MKKVPLITISRQYGSGGRDVGKALAERFAIPYYDNDSIAEALKDSGIPAEIVDGPEDQIAADIRFGVAANRDSRGELPINDRLWRVQSSFIRTVAETGPAVIVGRAADRILNGRTDAVRLFIRAPFEYRVRRVMRTEGMNRVQAEKKIRRKDKARAIYYEYYTDHRWGESAGYDLVINTGPIGIEKAVELVALYVEGRGETE